MSENLRIQEESQSSQLRKLEKERTNKSQSQQKERLDKDQSGNKSNRNKQKSKSLFLEKISKNDKPIARLSKKKREDSSQK